MFTESMNKGMEECVHSFAHQGVPYSYGRHETSVSEMEPPPQKKRRKTPSYDETRYHWIIHPNPSTEHGSSSFGPGSTVFFRPKSAKEKGRRGQIMRKGESNITGKDPGHVWIEYEANNVRSKKLVSARDSFRCSSPKTSSAAQS